MTHGCRLAIWVAVLAFPAAAWGNGILGLSRGSASHYRGMAVQPAPAGYCVCPVYVVPLCQPASSQPPFAATMAPPLSAGNAPPRNQAPSSLIYATPKAAPPSSGPVSGEPPRAAVAPPRNPSVGESRSYYEAFPVAVNEPGRRFGERCAIEFFNLTDKDLAMKIDGQPRTLARGKSLSLDLARRFAWQIEGRDVNQENIAMGEAAMQIVIRR